MVYLLCSAFDQANESDCVLVFDQANESACVLAFDQAKMKC
jgi:hypothetical protein